MRVGGALKILKQNRGLSQKGTQNRGGKIHFKLETCNATHDNKKELSLIVRGEPLGGRQEHRGREFVIKDNKNKLLWKRWRGANPVSGEKICSHRRERIKTGVSCSVRGKKNSSRAQKPRCSGRLERKGDSINCDKKSTEIAGKNSYIHSVGKSRRVLKRKN